MFLLPGRGIWDLEGKVQKDKVRKRKGQVLGPRMGSLFLYEVERKALLNSREPAVGAADTSTNLC